MGCALPNTKPTEKLTGYCWKTFIFVFLAFKTSPICGRNIQWKINLHLALFSPFNTTPNHLPSKFHYHTLLSFTYYIYQITYKKYRISECVKGRTVLHKLSFILVVIFVIRMYYIFTQLIICQITLSGFFHVELTNSIILNGKYV